MLTLTTLAVALALAPADPWPFGVCAHLGRGDEHGQLIEELDLMRAAGVGWARADFTWGDFEPRDGEWRFDNYDRVVAEAKTRGVNVLPILCYNVDWAFPAHEHLTEWCDYVRTVVTRYQADLRYWEVWNEPNIEFWKPKPDAAQYTALLKATYETIKAVDPDLRVVYGGTAGVPFDFLRATFELGALDAIDVLAIHPYRYPHAPETHGIAEDIRATLALMDEFGGRKPLWITEFGWPTHLTPAVQSPDFLPAMIVYAAQWRFPAQMEFRAAVLHEPGMPGSAELSFAVQGPLDARPDVEARIVGLADLAALDPEDTQILVMPTGEHYPADYFDHIVRFVRDGGLFVHLGGVPFYYKHSLVDGEWVQADPGETGRAALHVGWKAWWTEEGLPEKAAETVVALPEGSGITVPPGLASTRWLTDARLAPGDRFVPFLEAREGGNTVGAPVALYLYESDLRGAFLSVCLDLEVRGVPEERQALYLPRALMLCLAEGVETMLWYEFRDGGDDPTYNENRFGMIRNDLAPKPAYTALATMTRALGEARFLRRMETDSDVHWCVFDAGGTETHALWTLGGATEVSVPAGGGEVEVLDHLGRPVDANRDGDNLVVTVTDAVTYVTGVR